MSMHKLAMDLGGEDILRGDFPKEGDQPVGPKIPFFRYADQQDELMTRRQMGVSHSPYEGATCINENDPSAILFDQFCTANTFQSIVQSFQQLCDLVEEQPVDHEVFYQRLKLKLTSWKAQSLWSKLDKRSSNREYRNATCCLNTRVLVIGGGPCGLRTAIEVVLLGGKAVVVEKRDRFSRNNVLHLWPYLITDLKALGAKKFFGKFCAGAIDHISIRALECILLKVALLVGVEIHPGVAFIDTCEPPEPVPGKEPVGWRAKVSPPDHPVNEYQFDVLIGADGKRNTLQAFRRKEFRGKLAIAITANFINHNTQAEASVEEISGVAFIFNQKFFKDLNAQTGIDLENIVYYKDDTHYFVMTAKKHSLLLKGVLIQDFDDPARLLSKENVDQDCLLAYAMEAADVSTRQKLPKLDFAHNHYGQPDVAMFDFTSMFAAEHASRVTERNGHKLLISLVGDSLLEPFWPTGSGLARGFLGALDTAWMIRSWASSKMTPLEVMAERESIYQLLSQTTPENINKNFSQYTIDPNVRYPNLNPAFFKPHQVKRQYDGQDLAYLNQIVQIADLQSSRYEMIRDSHNLLKWFQRQLEPYRHIIRLLDLASSWQNGLALCALIHKYRPELLDMYALEHTKIAENNQLAFDIAAKEFGIGAITTGRAMANNDLPDKLSMKSYLSQFFEYFRKESIKPAKIARLPHPSKVRTKPRSPGSKLSMLNKLGSRIRQRREEFEKDNDNDFLKRPRQPVFTHGVAKKRLKEMEIEETPSVMLQGYKKLEGLEPETEESKILRVRREMKALRAGVRGQNKVSALAKDLADKFKGHETMETVDNKKTKPRPLLQKNADSDECYFCKKTVYLVERHSAEGLYFHRGCFRCEYCSTSLRIGGYSFLRTPAGEAKFYCHQHHGLKKPLRRPRKRSLGDNETANGLGTPPSLKVKIPSPGSLSPAGSSQVDGASKTPERIEYVTESEQEESEFEQTQHNLTASLLDEEDSESESSSDELAFDDGDNLSDGEISLVELARSYSKQLTKSLQKKKKKKKFLTVGGEDSGSDTETGTFGASDADWESGSDTERESDTESLFSRRRRRPSIQSQQEMSGLDRSKETSDVSNREKLLLSPTALKPFGYTSIYKAAPKHQEKKDLKPSPTTAAIMKNRMAFFSVVSEPVRIDAQSFLGLRPPPEEKKEEVIEELKVIPPVSPLSEEEARVVEEKKSKKKKKRRHGRGDKHRLTGEVEGSMLPGMQEAAPVITVIGSSDEEARGKEEEEEDDESTDKVTGEDDSSTEGESEESGSSESDTEDQVESIEDMLADAEHVTMKEQDESGESRSLMSDTGSGNKVEEAWDELMEEAKKSQPSGELMENDTVADVVDVDMDCRLNDGLVVNVLLDTPLIVVTAKPDDILLDTPLIVVTAEPDESFSDEGDQQSNDDQDDTRQESPPEIYDEVDVGMINDETAELESTEVKELDNNLDLDEVCDKLSEDGAPKESSPERLSDRIDTDDTTTTTSGRSGSEDRDTVEEREVSCAVVTNVLPSRETSTEKEIDEKVNVEVSELETQSSSHSEPKEVINPITTGIDSVPVVESSTEKSIEVAMETLDALESQSTSCSQSDSEPKVVVDPSISPSENEYTQPTLQNVSEGKDVTVNNEIVSKSDESEPSSRSDSQPKKLVEQNNCEINLPVNQSQVRSETLSEPINVVEEKLHDGESITVSYKSEVGSRSGSETREPVISRPVFPEGSPVADHVEEHREGIVPEVSAEDDQQTLDVHSEGTVSDSAKDTTNSDVVTDLDKLLVSGVTRDHSDVDFVDSSPVDNEGRLFVSGSGKMKANLASEEEMDDYTSDEFDYLVKDNLQHVVHDVLAVNASQSSDSDVVMETGTVATDMSATSSTTEIPSQASDVQHVLDNSAADPMDLCIEKDLSKVSVANLENIHDDITMDDITMDDIAKPAQDISMDVDVSDNNIESVSVSQISDVAPVSEPDKVTLEIVEKAEDESLSASSFSDIASNLSPHNSEENNVSLIDNNLLCENVSQHSKLNGADITEFDDISKCTQEQESCQTLDLTTIVNENLMDTSEVLDLTELAQDNLNETSDMSNLTMIANANLGDTTELVINNLGDTNEFVCDNIRAIAEQKPTEGDDSDMEELLGGTMELVQDNMVGDVECTDLTMLAEANLSDPAIVPDLSIMVEVNMEHLDVDDSLRVVPEPKQLTVDFNTEQSEHKVVSNEMEMNTTKPTVAPTETIINEEQANMDQIESEEIQLKVEPILSSASIVNDQMDSVMDTSEPDQSVVDDLAPKEFVEIEDFNMKEISKTESNLEVPMENVLVDSMDSDKVDECVDVEICPVPLETDCVEDASVTDNVLSEPDKSEQMVDEPCIETKHDDKIQSLDISNTILNEPTEEIQSREKKDVVVSDVQLMDIESELIVDTGDIDLTALALANLGDVSTIGDLTMIMEANKPHVDLDECELFIREEAQSVDESITPKDEVVNKDVAMDVIVDEDVSKVTGKISKTDSVTQVAKESNKSRPVSKKVTDSVEPKTCEVKSSAKSLDKGKEIKSGQSKSVRSIMPEVRKPKSSKLMDQSKTPIRPSRSKDQHRTQFKPSTSSEKSKSSKAHVRSKTPPKSLRSHVKSQAPKSSKSQDKARTPPRVTKPQSSNKSTKKDRAKEVELISKLDIQTFGSPELELEGLDEVKDLDKTKHSIRTKFGATDHRAQPKLHRSASSPIKPQSSVGPSSSTPKSASLERSSSLGSEEDRGLQRKCMSREDLQADAIKRIDDLISSLAEEKDTDTVADRADHMDTEEEADYKEILDTSQIVAFTVDDDKSGVEKSFSVDEKYVNLRDRRRRKHSSNQSNESKSVSESSSFTISTPSSSVASTSSISELHSTHTSTCNSNGPGVSSSTTDESLSKSKNTTPLEESISFEKLVEINADNEDLLDDLEIDAVHLTLDVNRSKHKDTQNNNYVANHSSPVNRSIPNNSQTFMSPVDNTPFVSANSTTATDDSCYYTPETSGVHPQVDSAKANKHTPFSSPSPVLRHDTKYNKGRSSDALSDASDQKSMHSNKSDKSHTSSSPYSPNKLKDAKWKFFSEAPMVVRMDHAKVFDDIPNKSNISAEVEASNKKNIEKSLELNTNWRGIESGTPTSPTAGVPHKDAISGENDVFYTPASSMKGKHTNGLSYRDEDLKKPEVRKRILPATPAERAKMDPSKKGVTAQEIRQLKADELEQNRVVARERARLKSDNQLGIAATGKDKKRPDTASGSHISRVHDKDLPTNKRPMSATADLAHKSDSSTLSSTDSPLRAPSASDGASTSDQSGASPNTDRKGKKDKKGKKSKEDKENRESDGKKEKKRSFLSLLLPSRSVDKKEKEKTKSPPPEKGSFFSKAKSPPLNKDRASSAQGRPASTEEQKRPVASQAPSTSGIKMRNRSKSPKNAADQIREEEIHRRSIYDEFAPLVEDIAEGSKKNKEDLQERLQQVAPPPAKAPYTSLRPPTATMDEFETESDAGDDKISVRSFQAVTQGMNEEDLAKMLKKQQKAVAKRQKESELKRLRVAQEIQRHLEEVEFKQRQVEEKGVGIERALRGEGKEVPSNMEDAEKDESVLMQDWFNIVHEKNMLVRYESELMVHARELELEDRQSRLEHQLRELISLEDAEKTSEKREEEQKVLKEILEVVEQRDALVALLEEDRLKPKEAPNTKDYNLQ